MSELPANLFEQQFLRLLQSRTGSRLPAESRRLLSRTIRDAINQHSCVDLKDEQVDVVEALRQFEGVGEPGESKPFTLSDNKLYLTRFYAYEKAVAQMLTNRNVALNEPPDALDKRLQALFNVKAANDSSEPDRQMLAAYLAATRRLAIITGGPGTGKTTTVARILDLLTEDNPDLLIRLAAPTGKASMRLAEALSSWSAGRQRQPQVQTLHRLLGMRRDTPGFRNSFRHNADNPIGADIVIVDEASMIDLIMMHRLLDALQDDTRLILLGDPNQLPSVDTGNVLADICAGDSGYSKAFAEKALPLIGAIPMTEQPHGLTDARCHLTKTWRFTPDSAIARFSSAVQSGQLPLSPMDESVQRRPPYHGDPAPLLDYFDSYLSVMDSADAALQLDVFEQVRVLCSRRGGEAGVLRINEDIEAALESEGIKERNEPFYHGRPILITRNDYNLGLYNGDIGICHQLEVPGQYQVIFASGERYLASRLPEHETCFAMTIHKSQGSEFEHVVLLLADEPSAEASEMITRELLYTAVTRTKQQLTVHASEETLRAGVLRSAARVSGMTGFLGITMSS